MTQPSRPRSHDHAVEARDLPRLRPCPTPNHPCQLECRRRTCATPCTTPPRRPEPRRWPSRRVFAGRRSRAFARMVASGEPRRRATSLRHFAERVKRGVGKAREGGVFRLRAGAGTRPGQDGWTRVTLRQQAETGQVADWAGKSRGGPSRAGQARSREKEAGVGRRPPRGPRGKGETERAEPRGEMEKAEFRPVGQIQSFSPFYLVNPGLNLNKS